jgi:Flp pilus assembly protein TadG
MSEPRRPTDTARGRSNQGLVARAGGRAGSPVGDGGALTAFVVLLMVAFLALLGLVADGGNALTAHQSAEVEAEQAARSGAGALDLDALRAGVVEIDPTAAVGAAEQFAMADGHPATATVSGGVVTVRVRYAVPTMVLGFLGIGSLQVSAVASAEDVHGVTTGVS